MMVPDVAAREYGALRYIVYGASPISEATLRRAMEVFGCDFVQGYGMTETTAAVTYLLPADHHRALRDKPELLLSAGRAMVGTEVRVVDANDQPVPLGEVGEIVARGPQMMRCYWNPRRGVARALRGGWMHTGDAGRMDEEGYLYISDRVKDMIVSGGENVYPREVEEVLFQHPAVADVAVIGVPDDKWGESVKAIVVLREGATVPAAEIIEQLPGAARGLQAAALGRLRHGAAAQPERQGPEARAARAVLGRTDATRVVKIVVLDGHTLDPGDNPWDELAALGELTVHERSARAGHRAARRDAAVVLTNKRCSTRRSSPSCPSCASIAVLATGYNVVDVAAARTHGVRVANVPEYGTDSVAQHVLAMLLELAHGVGEHDAAVHAGEWQRCPDFSFWAPSAARARRRNHGDRRLRTHRTARRYAGEGARHAGTGERASGLDARRNARCRRRVVLDRRALRRGRRGEPALPAHRGQRALRRRGIARPHEAERVPDQHRARRSDRTRARSRTRSTWVNRRCGARRRLGGADPRGQSAARGATLVS